jgi:hypothetical protein
MEDDSFFSVAGPGAGVDSLLEALLPAAAVVVVLVFSLLLPKKSFAVEGWVVGSGLGFAAGAGAWALDVEGAEAFEVEVAGATAAGGGRRAVRRLTFLLIIVPYCSAVLRGSSSAVRSWSSRVASERTWRSWFCQFETQNRTELLPLMDEARGCKYVSKKYSRIESVLLQENKYSMWYWVMFPPSKSSSLTNVMLSTELSPVPSSG